MSNPEPKNGQSQSRILQTREVAALVGVHRTTIFRWVAADIFPAPHEFSRQRIIWYAEEIEEWLKTRAQHRPMRQESKTESLAAERF